MNTQLEFLFDPSVNDLLSFGSVLLKVTLIAATGILLANCLRAQAAKLRHRILLASMGLTLLVPWMHYAASGWSFELPRLAFLTHEQSLTTQAEPGRSDGQPLQLISTPGSVEATQIEVEHRNRPDVEINAAEDESVRSTVEGSLANKNVSSVLPFQPSASDLNRGRSATVWLVMSLFLIWGVGTAVSWSRMLIGWFLLNRKLTQANSVVADERSLANVLTQFEICKLDSNHSGTIDIRFSPAAITPMVTGLVHPVIVLQ